MMMKIEDTINKMLVEGSKMLGVEIVRASFHQKWRSLFGCAINVVVDIWFELEKNSLIQKRKHFNVETKHLLSALFNLKGYPNEATACIIAGGVDVKTWRKYT